MFAQWLISGGPGGGGWSQSCFSFEAGSALALFQELATATYTSPKHPGAEDRSSDTLPSDGQAGVLSPSSDSSSGREESQLGKDS